MTGVDHCHMPHCTIGHMRCVDGALPDFEDGVKALNVLAPRGEHRLTFCIFYIFYIFYIFQHIVFVVVRHCLRSLRQVYGSWYYLMLYYGIANSECTLKGHIMHIVIIIIMHIHHILHIDKLCDLC